jgi:hypothetical protein
LASLGMKQLKIEKLERDEKRSYTYAIGTARAEKTDAASRFASSAGRALATASLSNGTCYKDAAESEDVENIESESHVRLCWR